jgi:arylsulfatase A-like enzyme
MFIFMLAALISSGNSLRAADAETKPNIILMFIDDLGYGDIGPYGCEDIPTPNIDRLAREGTTSTTFYITNPPCSPSRHALMMGEYAQRSGKFGMARGLPLPENRPTMAKFLSEAGYQTAQIGKWDMGNMQQGPLNIGFNETNRTPPKKKYSKAELESIQKIRKVGEKQLRYMVVDEKGDDKLLIEYEGEQIVDFIERTHTDPFFLYYSPFGVHGPHVDMPKHILARVPDEVKGPRRYLAASIMAIDDQVGHVLDVLERKGIRDNTLIVFASDNGADPNRGGTSTPYAGGKGKGTQKEGWVRTPAIFSQPGVVPEGKVYDGMICSLDLYATFASLTENDSPKHLDGVNLIPYFQEKVKGDPHEFLFWLNNDPTDAPRRHLVAVRWKNWRLYKYEEPEPWQLFDLKNDPKEETNVADKFPELVEKLNQEFSGWKRTLPEWKPMPDPGKGIPIPQGHGWTSLN